MRDDPPTVPSTDLDIALSVRWMMARAVDREVFVNAGVYGESEARWLPETARIVAEFQDDEAAFISVIARLIATWEWERVVARVPRDSDPKKVMIIRAIDTLWAVVGNALAAVVKAEPTQPGNAVRERRTEPFRIAAVALTDQQRRIVVEAEFRTERVSPAILKQVRDLLAKDAFGANRARHIGKASQCVADAREASGWRHHPRDWRDVLAVDLKIVRSMRDRRIESTNAELAVHDQIELALRHVFHVDPELIPDIMYLIPPIGFQAVRK